MPALLPRAVPELLAEGLCLRALVEDDIAPWFERATDVASADLAGDPVPRSIDEGVVWLERQRQRFIEQRGIRWAIVPAGHPTSVGTVGLSLVAGEPAADLGIVIARRYWRKGLGSSAVSLVTRYAFGTLGLNEIRADVLPRNVASIRMLEGCGFVYVCLKPPTEDELEALAAYVLSAENDR